MRWESWIAAVLLFTALSCASPREPVAARHLLLITLDTTRADRLGAYGHPGAGTPTLDALAESGTLFERAYAQSPLTLPSHASILTGLQPTRTGIHVNGQREMRAEARTLAELLAEQGFLTAASVGGYPVSGRFPVSRGFRHFDDRMVDPRNPAGLERDAGDVVAAALRLVERRDGRRLFLWVHFYDPHDPYAPPPPFRQRFADDPYQGEIARVDAALAELLQGLETRLDRDELLICVVGDHGEGLGDHGEPTHGFFLYESTVRVPLILEGPRVPRGREAAAPVQTVDLVPTLLAMLDLSIPAGLDGSVLDLEADRHADSGRIYLETELPLRSYGWSPLRGVVDGWLKYVAAPRPELYDLRADPAELINVVAEMPGERTELAQWLGDFSAAEPASAGPPVLPDPRLASLGYIGSASPAAAAGGLADPKDRLDVYLRFVSANRFLEEGRPEEALPLLDELIAEDNAAGSRLKRAQALRMSGRLDQADAELVRLEEEGLMLEPVALERARIAIWRNDAPLALQKLELYLASAPGDAEALMFHGAALEMLGEAEGAEADYRRALALNPAFHGASLRLGALLLVTGRNEEARRHLTAHTARYPNDDIARGLLESLPHD